MGGLIMASEFRLLLVAVVSIGLVAGGPSALAQDSAVSRAQLVEKRAPVVLRPAEKTALLADMRDYLKGLQDIFAALARDDMAAVSARAREMGLINVYETTLMFPTTSGVRFRELAAAVHEDFEEVANAADKQQRAKRPDARKQKEILGMLAGTMKRCVSCHESYRLTDMGHAQ